MPHVTTRQIVLKNYPHLIPNHHDVAIKHVTLELKFTGYILVKILFISVDPYMRQRLRPAGLCHLPIFKLHMPLESLAIAEVVATHSDDFKVGDKVMGMLPWQDYAVISVSKVQSIYADLSMPMQLSALGMTGFTAYVGLKKLISIRSGETLFISAAAGAVGSIAGQIARLMQTNVIGCVGNEEKVCFVKQVLKFDAVFNYKKYSTQLNHIIAEYCPNGIDIDFENVGGELFEAVIGRMNFNSKIILCGLIAQYNTDKPRRSPNNFSLLMRKKTAVIPYIVTDYVEKYWDEFRTQMRHWLLTEQIKSYETITFGLENTWTAFIGLFSGKNIGKQIVCL
ncbi:MAG: NADP-dependent oxidoreductase [Gammaproteobacteria bacterium]